MKTFDSIKENSLKRNICNESEEIENIIINSGNRNHSLLKCNHDLVKSYNVLKSVSVERKFRFYKRIIGKNNNQESCSSQSMPNFFDNDLDVSSNCDSESKLLVEEKSLLQSSFEERRCSTWPQRCDKIRNNGNLNEETFENNTLKSKEKSYACNKPLNSVSVNNKVTLNEALQNISLAYSPVTKQLHLLSKNKTIDEHLNNSDVDDLNNKYNINDERNQNFQRKRNDPGSFSSTISSLSSPLPASTRLEIDEIPSNSNENVDYKFHKKGKSLSFFNRNMFSWRTSSSSNLSGWKLFNNSSSDNLTYTPKLESTASSSALIQLRRPSNLPAKTLEEENRHQLEYKAIVAAAKKKEVQDSIARNKKRKMLLHQEEQLAASTKHFFQVVLPSWESMCKTRKTKDLWWQGLPSSVRGRVWCLAIGNDLNLTQQLYEICLQRAQNRLNSPELSNCDSDVDQESSMNVIQLDISRTFPNLCIFQEGGPYFDVLHSLLAAYASYRPDVGYVQGMSFIAAILLLNMDEVDAFVCFANLINRPLHLAAFTLNQFQMQAYYCAYNIAFRCNLPTLYSHFEKAGLSPDFYLLDWIYTIFAKAMPLDVACRVWDVFLRDGDEFIFRSAIGVLHLNQELLMEMDFLQGAQFLTRLPDDISSDLLFKSIQAVNINIGKQTFSQIVERCKK